MPNWNWWEALRGAAGGAATGSLAGTPGAIIGGVLGAVTGGMSSSPEQERARRRAELMKRINEIRARTLAEQSKLIDEGARRIAETMASQSALERQAAARRAAAAGFGSEAESFILPAEGRVLQAGSEALKNYNLAGSRVMADLARSFDQAELTGELDYANRPIEPSITDYLQEIGSAALQYKLGSEAINRMSANDYNADTTTTAWATPVTIKKPTNVPPLPMFDFRARLQEDPLKAKLKEFVMRRGLQRSRPSIAPR